MKDVICTAADSLFFLLLSKADDDDDDDHMINKEKEDYLEREARIRQA
jgi:hypothetical protein